jgi:hypothetical protein
MSLEVAQTDCYNQGSGQVILHSMRIRVRIGPPHPLVCVRVDKMGWSFG